VAIDHLEYVRNQGGVVYWAQDLRGSLKDYFQRECQRLTAAGCSIYVTVDSDVVHLAEMPGVSAPNPLGLAGAEVIECIQRAGATPGVSSIDLVEINPRFDRGGVSARWAALAIWHFLVGLALRTHENA
jgi:formiminoglutamase